MHFLLFEAHPKPLAADYGRVDGAFVAVYVKESVPAVAEAAARAFLDQAGWDITDLEESYPISVADLPPDHPNRPKYDEAEASGMSVWFHTWPIGGDVDQVDPHGGAA